MSLLERCKTCGQLLPSQNLESDELTKYIQSLFDYRGDLIDDRASSIAPNGVPVVTFARGIAIRHDQPPPIAALEGSVREIFQRTFGEGRTDRAFYWGEKPNIMVDYDFYTRNRRYALWMAFSLEGITKEEEKNLRLLGEGENIQFIAPPRIDAPYL